MRRARAIVWSMWIAGAALVGSPVLHSQDRGSGLPVPRRPGAAGVAPEAGATVQFVTCPIYRDTDMGRKSGCWLADDSSDRVRYDVTWAPIKPQHGKAILVEGVVTADADTCGGVVLNPVRVSVLEGGCPETMIPAEQYPGRPSPPPVAVLAPASEPRVLPPPPYPPRDFTIYFEFGRDFLIYQHAEVVLEQIRLYAQASQARSLRIEGFAATDPVLVSRRSIAEDASLADARAAMVHEALIRLGVAKERLERAASGSPTPTDLEGGKLPESSKRRVTVTVTP
jgi:outer membrane protein OmpA-like peptidoglycan-associated protein